MKEFTMVTLFYVLKLNLEMKLLSEKVVKAPELLKKNTEASWKEGVAV